MSSETTPPADADRLALSYHLALAATGEWAERLVATVEASPPTTPVPTCPGWDLAKLLRHTGRVHRHVAALVEQRVVDVPGPDLADFEMPARDAQASSWTAWYRAGAKRLLTALADTPPNTPVWAWGPDQRANFWARRVAHETVIHAVDALLATGAEFAIEPTLAVDGLDELLENLAFSPTFTQREAPFAGSGTVHLHATDQSLADGHGEWMIGFDPDGYEFSHGHGKGDVAVKAPAETLELLTLGRISADTDRGDVEVFGDRDVLDRWLEGVRFS